jgi:hypothetical protein
MALVIFFAVLWSYTERINLFYRVTEWIEMFKPCVDDDDDDDDDHVDDDIMEHTCLSLVMGGSSSPLL